MKYITGIANGTGTITLTWSDGTTTVVQKLGSTLNVSDEASDLLVLLTPSLPPIEIYFDNVASPSTADIAALMVELTSYIDATLLA